MDRSEITVGLAEQLVAQQFPDWRTLPVTRLGGNGWDNTTFRLGPEMSIRLPNGERYSAQVEKEHWWLLTFEPQLPLPIPTPLAKGEPSSAFPRPWSIYGWLPGATATVSEIDDLERFATDLAGFLRALYGIDVDGGPTAGPPNQGRGGPLSQWEEMTRAAIVDCADSIDRRAVQRAWERSLEADFAGPPVWVHGDVSASNLLVSGGRLSAVIDFGCSAVGDPACDMVIAYTLLDERSRRVFRSALDVDDATWERGRGWALWKALLVLGDDVQGSGNHPKWHEMGWRITAAEIIAEIAGS